MTNHRVKMILEEIEPLIDDIRMKAIICGVLGAIDNDHLTELANFINDFAQEQLDRMDREDREHAERN